MKKSVEIMLNGRKFTLLELEHITSYWAKLSHDQRLGNKIVSSGCTRCECRGKYWENDTCISCGIVALEVDADANLVLSDGRIVAHKEDNHG
jgi:hypothetical protein